MSIAVISAPFPLRNLRKNDFVEVEILKMKMVSIPKKYADSQINWIHWYELKSLKAKQQNWRNKTKNFELQRHRAIRNWKRSFIRRDTRD